jgi:hypothetical protein
MEITLFPFIAKVILRFNPFRRAMVMCHGYNEDYINYTELVWEDDQSLDFFDQVSYPRFQLWIA